MKCPDCGTEINPKLIEPLRFYCGKCNVWFVDRDYREGRQAEEKASGEHQQ